MAPPKLSPAMKRILGPKWAAIAVVALAIYGFFQGGGLPNLGPAPEKGAPQRPADPDEGSPSKSAPKKSSTASTSTKPPASSKVSTAPSTNSRGDESAADLERELGVTSGSTATAERSTAPTTTSKPASPASKPTTNSPKPSNTAAKPNKPAPAAPAENPFLIRNVTIRDQDGDVVYKGDIDLQPTLDRIERGERHSHRNDGSTFRNLEGRLPKQPSGYYKEYVHPTEDLGGPGPQRVVLGQKGEIYYTHDHYQSFKKLK
jgi:ribonuclease T1